MRVDKESAFIPGYCSLLPTKAVAGTMAGTMYMGLFQTDLHSCSKVYKIASASGYLDHPWHGRNHVHNQNYSQNYSQNHKEKLQPHVSETFPSARSLT